MIYDKDEQYLQTPNYVICDICKVRRDTNLMETCKSKECMERMTGKKGQEARLKKILRDVHR